MRLVNLFRRLFDSSQGLSDRLIPRWLLLRALAVWYLSAFYSLLFQIKGLIGPNGILPAGKYLAAVQHAFPGLARFWYAPSLFWISAGNPMLMAVTWLGLLAAVFAFLNLWPRISFLLCFVCFLSFVSTANDFSGYQSDGMLLEAGFLAIFLAPPGALPGWGANHPPSRASYFLLLWEWFRIYFESGLVKIFSGDPQWRNFTAMDDYYQNLPLPTWTGWYAGHFPHWFHVASTAGTLLLEYVVVLMLFLPRRARIVCFLIVTPWQLGVILSGNYAFLNYLVLSLAILLLDDPALRKFIPSGFKPLTNYHPPDVEHTTAFGGKPGRPFRIPRLAFAAIFLTWIAYATTAELAGFFIHPSQLAELPVEALEPFRIANQYGLFAIMTHGRYEIEFQGSNDNQTWSPYPFQYKPQSLNERPGIYAPYQPRFEWNLWFASLGDWDQNQIVPLTEERLLANDSDVLSLFRGNPFPQAPPRFVRAVLWQYWFTSIAQKRQTGNWWRRSLLGQYAPTLTRVDNGTVVAIQPADQLPTHD